MKRVKIILAAGARPNFMKIAPLFRELKKYKGRFFPIIVHTGQHYDHGMSGVFFNDLDMQKPHYYLGVGSGSHAHQTAEAMKKFEKVCVKEKPRLIIVVGDVNSTLACSITAKKLHIRVAHVEAGLRSRDMSMPEEMNRIVTDNVSDFLFVTEKKGVENLIKEGRNKNDIFLVGNTMIDSLKFSLNRLRESDIGKFQTSLLAEELKNYGVVTLHRPSNVDNKSNLLKLVRILNKISGKAPLFFPIHPRTEKNIKRFKTILSKNIHVIKPLGYLEFLFLCKGAKFILTDSGGIQEEASFLNIPCFTLRKNTERPVTIESGTNILVGERINRLPSLVDKSLDKSSAKRRTIPLWDGKAAVRIIKILNKVL